MNSLCLYSLFILVGLFFPAQGAAQSSHFYGELIHTNPYEIRKFDNYYLGADSEEVARYQIHSLFAGYATLNRKNEVKRVDEIFQSTWFNELALPDSHQVTYRELIRPGLRIYESLGLRTPIIHHYNYRFSYDSLQKLTHVKGLHSISTEPEKEEQDIQNEYLDNWLSKQTIITRRVYPEGKMIRGTPYSLYNDTMCNSYELIYQSPDTIEKGIVWNREFKRYLNCPEYATIPLPGELDSVFAQYQEPDAAHEVMASLPQPVPYEVAALIAHCGYFQQYSIQCKIQGNEKLTYNHQGQLILFQVYRNNRIHHEIHFEYNSRGLLSLCRMNNDRHALVFFYVFDKVGLPSE